MKLTKLSNELLGYMVKTYRATHNKGFDFTQFKNLHPNLDDEFISDALYLLQEKGFVQVSPFDGKAYFTCLDVSAIDNAENNSAFKKFYQLAKEIKSWF